MHSHTHNFELRTKYVVILTSAMIWDIVWLDALGAIISSGVIIKWSVGLLRDSGRVLLDMEKI